MCLELGWIINIPNDIVSLFQIWPNRPKDGILRSLWEISPSCLVWEFWKEHNKRLFDGKATNIESFLSSLEAAIVENINNRLALSSNLDKAFTTWDGRIRFRWNGIKVPLFLGKKNNDRGSAVWTPPEIGWLKLNFDGAPKGNPGDFGVGCVVKDHRGVVKGKIVVPTPLDTNNIAEFKTLLLGLTKCSKRGIKNLVIEGDSTISINAIKTTSSPSWRVHALLDKILEVLPMFDNFSCKHIYREANTDANALPRLLLMELHS